MDQLLKPIQDALEGPIDFQGQQLTETISTVLLAVAGLLAFAAGLVQQDIYLTLWIGIAGTVLIILITVPPWPIYNKNPIHWLPARNGITGAITVDGKRIN